MARVTVFVAVLIFIAITQSFADVELVLIDERQLRGNAIERLGGEFILENESGSVLIIPVEFVAEIRLRGERSTLCEHGGETRREVETHRSRGDGIRAVPSRHSRPRSNGDRHAGPADPGDTKRSTTGGTPRPHRLSTSPSRSEQLAVFGADPVTFRRGLGSRTWKYEDVLGKETDVTQFRPSRWYRSQIVPGWDYADELGFDSDVIQFNPSTWQRSKSAWRWFPSDVSWQAGFLTRYD